MNFIIHPEGFLLSAFCFVMAKMVGSIGDILVYNGQASVPFVGLLGLLILAAAVGFLYNSLERDP